MALDLQDTIALTFVPYKQVSIMKNFDYFGIGGALVHSTGTTVPYVEKYNGIIGLSAKSSASQGNNIIAQAIKQGFVTNSIFAIYLDKAKPSASTLTIGSWDAEGVDPQEQMNIA